MEKSLDMLNGSISKKLLLFFYPVFLASIFQQIYNTVDAIIIGKFVGKYALAAVGGSTGSLFNLFTGFAVGITSGASVVIAQQYGKGNKEQLSRAIQTAVIFNVLLGTFFTFIVYSNAESILKYLGVPSEILHDSLVYLRVVFLGFVSSQLYNIGNSILRAVGETKKPVVYLIISCTLNIFLDLLFVVKFNLGVFGVAIATVIAQTFSAILVLYELIFANRYYRLFLNKVLFDIKILKELLLIGVPAGIQSALFSISNLIIQSSVNSLGTDYVASWTAIGKIISFYWLIIGSLGISITTFVAQNFGAKQYDRVRKSIKECLKLSIIFTVILSIVMYIFAPDILNLFMKDTEIINLGVKYLRMLVPTLILYVGFEVISGSLRGIGDAIIPSLLSLFGICCIRVLWIRIVFSNNPTMENVVYCYPVTWIITTILFVMYYLIFKPIKKKIEMEENNNHENSFD